MRYIAAHSCGQYPMLAKCFVTIQTHKQAFTKGSINTNMSTTHNHKNKQEDNSYKIMKFL